MILSIILRKESVFDEIAGRIKSQMEGWMDGQVRVETIVFSNDYTRLVETTGAEDMMYRLKGEGN